MRSVVWCVLVDGPYEGAVYEIGGNDRELTITRVGEGCCVYRRTGWAKDSHIAMFKFTKQLVI